MWALGLVVFVVCGGGAFAVLLSRAELISDAVCCLQCSSSLRESYSYKKHRVIILYLSLSPDGALAMHGHARSTTLCNYILKPNDFFQPHQQKGLA